MRSVCTLRPAILITNNTDNALPTNAPPVNPSCAQLENIPWLATENPASDITMTAPNMAPELMPNK